MEIITFEIRKEAKELRGFLNNESYTVRKLLPFGHDNELVLVVYEVKEEQLINEGARLGQIQEVAHSVKDDNLYSELKNANQRCLYLLDKYHIPKSIALDVIDEVKVLELTGK